MDQGTTDQGNIQDDNQAPVQDDNQAQAQDDSQGQDQGTIVRLMDKGYGFIRKDGEEKDLFFHANEMKDVHFNDLKENMKVTFEVKEGDKGPHASNVRIIEE